MDQLANLEDRRYFPTFKQCPDENDVDLEFYESTNGFMFEPRKHWCLFAEIESADYLFRLRLVARDRDGIRFPVAFHLEDGDSDFDLSQFRVGRTIAILYAHEHGFMDMTIGIRQEDAISICVLPMSLDELFGLNGKVQAQMPDQSGNMQCHNCGENEKKLNPCAACKIFYYCSKDCQVEAWKYKDHKKDCKMLREVAPFMRTKWSDFVKHMNFPLQILT